MNKRSILVTSTSFIDTAGPHQEELRKTAERIVTARGPLSERELLEVISDSGPFDGVICGEDDFTPVVLQRLTPNTKVISKYGVGLDRIDLASAETLGIKVTNTPGVNHNTVAELTIGLMIALARHIGDCNQAVHRGEWRKKTGIELSGKTLGIIGFGRVGKAVALRSMALGLNVLVHNSSWSKENQSWIEQANNLFTLPQPTMWETAPTISFSRSLERTLESSELISLHMNLTKENHAMISGKRMEHFKAGALLINVSRAALVDEMAVAEALKNGQLGGYAADVIAGEPNIKSSPLLGLPRVILTPHIGSRTTDSVVRQGLAAVRNLDGCVKTLQEPSHSR